MNARTQVAAVLAVLASVSAGAAETTQANVNTKQAKASPAKATLTRLIASSDKQFDIFWKNVTRESGA